MIAAGRAEPRADGDPSPLYSNPDLACFYDIGGRARQDHAYCARLAEEAASVLDLGCGTGDLARRLGGGRLVVGVDPAAGMLAIARARDTGSRVEWVEADAAEVRFGRTFDLVVLTGHAFQVFLSDERQLMVLRTIAAHLGSAGRFVFDTRNPDHPAPKERTGSETLRRIEHPELGVVERWNESTFDARRGVLTYSNSYRIVSTGEIRSAVDRVRYTHRSDLGDRLARAGLTVDRWLGDWTGSAFEPRSSEIIPLGRLA